MPGQENGNIKQMKIRVPMAVYRQLEIDAEQHNEETSTRGRHILMDALMNINVSTDKERAIIAKMVEENWKAILKTREKRAAKTRKEKV